MKRTIRKIGIIFLIAVLLLTVVKDILIQTTISSVGSFVIGAPLKVGGFSWNLLTQKLRISDLRLYNPQGFPDQPMVDISRISVNYDMVALLKGKLHFPYVNVDLKETVIVKNKAGQLNVDALKIAQKKDESTPKSGSGKRVDIPLEIDLMKLNIERTVFQDFSRGEKPVVEVFDVGLKGKTFKNIKSVNQLATVILVHGMGPAAIKGAAIYGAAAVLGVAFLPVAAAGLIYNFGKKLK